MKGAFVIVIIALIYYCSLTSGINRSSIKAEATVEEILKANFTNFANRLQVIAPTVWQRIVNASTTDYITVFAPTNAATLQNNNTNGDQLAYHVVPGDFGINQIMEYTTLYTLYNEANLNNHAQVLAFTRFNSTKGYNATINGDVNLAEADIIGSNGIVHAITAFVAIPSQNVGEVLGKEFPTLSALAKRVNQTLTAKYITLLAPTEAAFQTLFSQNALLAPYLTNTSFPSTFTNINNILNAHVVTEPFYPSTISNTSSTYTTLAGSTIRVNRTNTFEVVAENSVAATAVAVNMLASNGVAHSINNVLVPANINIDLLDALKTIGATSFIDVVTTFNLQGLLNETNIYTIFVPTNAALSKSNVTNQDQAMYHVAGVRNANFNNNLMPSLLTLASLSGNAQKLFGSTTNSSTTNSTRYINGVACTGPYLTTRGTAIYTIDTTLQVPVTALSSLTAASFTTFVGLLQENQLIRRYASLDNASTTLFAPTDAAFNALPHGALGFLRTNYTDEVPIATAVINNHIVPASLIYQFNDPNISLVTANNGERIDIVTVGRNPSTIYNGNQRITISDVPVLLENGVAHPIDQVIVPTNVAFNAINLLEGLGHENGSTSGPTWGSYTQFVEACKQSGLIYTLEDDKLSFTVFAPNDDAWGKASEKFDFANFGNDTDKLHRLQEILNNHIVYEDIDELNNTNWYRVGGTNNTINITGDEQVTLFFAGNSAPQGTANIKVNTTTSYMQKIYGIDRVLGVGVENSKKSGLTTLEWILIGVGGAVLGLIILLIVAGAAYYLLVRPKSGYRKIN